MAAVKCYPSTEKLFTFNGIKIIQPYFCKVRKVDNGDYYVEIESPLSDFDYLQQDMIVRVKTPWGWQGFRLNKPLRTSHRVKVKGWHLSYDASRYTIQSVEIDRKSGSMAVDMLVGGCDSTTPFSITSNITDKHTYTCKNTSLQEALQNVTELWNGHIVRDNWNIAINASIGEDRGVTLAYGKNITDISAEEDWSEVCTKILPVGKDEINLTTPYIRSSVQYDVPYTKVVKFEQSIDKSDEESEAEFLSRLRADLRTKAEAYLAAHALPKVNYTLKAHIDNVADVGDIIRVKHPRCKIDIVTNVISVTYDAIKERYDEIEFGNFREARLENLMTKVEERIEKVKAKTDEKFTKALQESTNKWFEWLGSSHAIYDADRMLFVDTLPKENATNVMMLGLGGISFSHRGINGPFSSAWSIDGTLDMSKINVVNIDAMHIKASDIIVDSLQAEDLSAFNAKCGGWNLESNAMYSRYKVNGQKYLLYLQAYGFTQGSNTGGYVMGLCKEWSDNSRTYLYAVSPSGGIIASDLVRTQTGFTVTNDFNTGTNIFAVSATADNDGYRMHLDGNAAFSGKIRANDINLPVGQYRMDIAGVIADLRSRVYNLEQRS